MKISDFFHRTVHFAHDDKRNWTYEICGRSIAHRARAACSAATRQAVSWVMSSTCMYSQPSISPPESDDVPLITTEYSQSLSSIFVAVHFDRTSLGARRHGYPRS